jgi:hypothetical protein
MRTAQLEKFAPALQAVMGKRFERSLVAKAGPLARQTVEVLLGLISSDGMC